MFSLTPAAAQEILAAAARSNAAGMALRVAARQVADGSIEFGMGFDEEREDDRPVEFGGLTVLVGSPSRALLDATVLDFAEVEPGRRDFVLLSCDDVVAAESDTSVPKARSGCGGGCSSCGT